VASAARGGGAATGRPPRGRRRPRAASARAPRPRRGSPALAPVRRRGKERQQRCLGLGCRVAALAQPRLGDPRGAAAAAPLSPFALWRLAEAAIALGALALVARRLRADRASLSLRWPGPTTVVLACAGAVAAGPLALVLSAAVAAPFFGGFRLELGLAGAIVPALVFSASNGAMEELLYRGALQGWAARAIGRSGAFVFQAAVFGFAHAGPDFVASPAPVVLALTAAAMLAGLIVWRTRSLLLPIAVHAAFDIPIYYYFACRVGCGAGRRSQTGGHGAH